jgi:hypothetical protein
LSLPKQAWAYFLAPKRLLNFSIWPALSSTFCLPV